MQKNNFDFLRFLFAFIVVIGHIIVITGIEEFQSYKYLFNTYISVTGFFCISGFLITKSYFNSRNYKDYIIKRAARLLPAYILIILVCFVFFSQISTYSTSEYFLNTITYKYLAANLTFLNFVQPTLPGVFLKNGIEYPVNGALWTLKIEVGFYILLPLILYILNKRSNKLILLTVIYILSVIYNYYFQYLFAETNNQFYSTLAHQLPAFLSYFSCGIALYYYFDLFIKRKNTLLVVGIIIYSIEYFLKIEILSPLALSFIIFAIAYTNLRVESFAKYGDFSYGIYIYHFPLINLAIYFGFFEKFNPYATSIILIITLLTISYFSWHSLESYFLRKVKSQRTIS